MPISWDGVSPLVTGPGGVAWKQQVTFEKEWRRFLDSPGRNTAVRYFRGGEAVLPRMEEQQNIPLLVRGVTAAEGSDQVIAGRSTIEDVGVAARGRQWLGIHDPQSMICYRAEVHKPNTPSIDSIKPSITVYHDEYGANGPMYLWERLPYSLPCVHNQGFPG
ncbi:hypothetical protein PSPO01_15624 [Paraphaeosphaeria sporulosa]